MKVQFHCEACWKNVRSGEFGFLQFSFTTLNEAIKHIMETGHNLVLLTED